MEVAFIYRLGLTRDATATAEREEEEGRTPLVLFSRPEAHSPDTPAPSCRPLLLFQMCPFSGRFSAGTTAGTKEARDTAGAEARKVPSPSKFSGR